MKKQNLSLSEKIVNFLCEKLVRNKIKKQFGGNLQAFVSGGGALDHKYWRIFKCCWIANLARIRSYRSVTSREL